VIGVAAWGRTVLPARAFGDSALAPKLPGAERAQALTAAKVALAKTGFVEEATALARAIAALLPAEPGAATAEIVEALKYPTATEAPSDVLVHGECLARGVQGDHRQNAARSDGLEMARGSSARRRTLD
jgi:hypothetical protein